MEPKLYLLRNKRTGNFYIYRLMKRPEENQVNKVIGPFEDITEVNYYIKDDMEEKYGKS